MPNDANDQGQQQDQNGQKPNDQGQKPQDQGGKPNGQQQQQDTPHASDQRPGADKSGEDARQRGIVADLQKERQARQKLQTQLDQLTGEREADRRRIAALAGVNTPSAEEAEIEQVRARLVQLFPALGKLSEEGFLDALQNLTESSAGIQEATQHHWQAHGRQMLDTLTNAVAEEIGGDLSERQKKALARAYVAEAEADPEFLKRHEAGDPKLVAEFAKQWVEDWLEPARKQVVTQEVSRRRPVPNGRDRNVQTTPAKKVDFKDPKAVEDAMVESFRSHGGRFES